MADFNDVFRTGDTGLSMGNEKSMIEQVIRERGNIKVETTMRDIRNLALENFLNGIIYGENGEKSGVDYSALINTTTSSVEKTVLERLSNINLNGIMERTSNAGVNLARAHIEYENVTSILDAVSTKYDQIMQAINSGKIQDYSQEVQDMANEMRRAYNYIKQRIGNKLKTESGMITVASAMMDGNSFDFGKFRHYYLTLRELDKILLSLPNVNELGDNFERYLTQALSNLTQEQYNELMQILGSSFTKVTQTGGINIARNGGRGGPLLSFNITNDFAKLIPQGPKQNTNWRTSMIGDGYSITITPESAKQGKADVTFELPNGSFRGMSLKNWASLAGSNKQFGFGETDVLSALIRSSGLDSTQSYALTVLREGYYGMDCGAEQFARICIIADILMGYSQQNGWATDLVINDRSAKRIFVYNIPNLIMNMMTALDIQGYNHSDIQIDAIALYEGVKDMDSGRTEAYIGMMFSDLYSRLVSVHLTGAAMA